MCFETDYKIGVKLSLNHCNEQLFVSATINLNEIPKQEEVRSADVSKNMTMDPVNQITVENIQHTTLEDPGKQIKDKSK